jgi:hypothetical protein
VDDAVETAPDETLGRASGISRKGRRRRRARREEWRDALLRETRAAPTAAPTSPPFDETAGWPDDPPLQQLPHRSGSATAAAIRRWLVAQFAMEWQAWQDELGRETEPAPEAFLPGWTAFVAAMDGLIAELSAASSDAGLAERMASHGELTSELAHAIAASGPAWGSATLVAALADLRDWLDGWTLALARHAVGPRLTEVERRHQILKGAQKNASRTLLSLIERGSSLSARSTPQRDGPAEHVLVRLGDTVTDVLSPSAEALTGLSLLPDGWLGQLRGAESDELAILLPRLAACAVEDLQTLSDHIRRLGILDQRLTELWLRHTGQSAVVGPLPAGHGPSAAEMVSRHLRETGRLVVRHRTTVGPLSDALRRLHGAFGEVLSSSHHLSLEQFRARAAAVSDLRLSDGP